MCSAFDGVNIVAIGKYGFGVSRAVLHGYFDGHAIPFSDDRNRFLMDRRAAFIKIMNKLDQTVTSAGGALYPAKDARMSAELFRSGYPKLDEFEAHIDPHFSSSFWRRVRA